MRTILLFIAVFLLGACDQPAVVADADADDGVRAAVERVLDDAAVRLGQVTDSVDALLQPVPLLTGVEEAAMRRYGNEEHLARARALGVRAADSTEIAALLASGRLVELDDSTTLWVVRRLEHSVALLTPDAQSLLTRIALEFHQRLAELGLPAYRIEVTSVLRTAETQAELRRTNANAAAGESTHEFGTTLDLAYSSFAAPHDPELGIDVSPAPWLEPRIDRIAGVFLETAAARRSRELQAILGKVLLGFQRDGDVYVTLERQQSVFHITVARRQRV